MKAAYLAYEEEHGDLPTAEQIRGVLQAAGDFRFLPDDESRGTGSSMALVFGEVMSWTQFKDLGKNIRRAHKKR